MCGVRLERFSCCCIGQAERGKRTASAAPPGAATSFGFSREVRAIHYRENRSRSPTHSKTANE